MQPFIDRTVVDRLGMIWLHPMYGSYQMENVNIHPRSPSIPTAGLGVTLIELMVGVAVLSILLALAVPSFQVQLASGRVSSAASDFYTSVNRARTTAISLGRRVTMCRSSDGSNCTQSSSSGWEVGWVIFTDLHHDGNDAAIDVDETSTWKSSALSTDLRIVGNANVADYISFGPDGRARLMNGAFQAGTIRVCSTSTALSNAQRARDMVLIGTGRMVQTIPTDVGASCPSP